MRDQLIQYVRLLFAGTLDTDDIQQEILQNTLDKYDDLVSQGKSPEAAYRLAISGIGDINEILGYLPTAPTASPTPEQEKHNSKLMRSIAIALYILCPVPLFLIGNEVGLCLLLAMAAAATALLILFDKDEKESSPEKQKSEDIYSPSRQLRKAIGSITWVVGLCVYIAVSFATGAWWITWLIFPMIGSVQGIINAILDLKEACRHEK